jgi:hypothetical protein
MGFQRIRLVFVCDKKPGIHIVSRSRTSTTNEDGVNRVRIWTPRDLRNIYQYEIYAPGGIDVPLTLGRIGNPFYSQNEVAFPGGIAPQYIRSVRQYDSNGRVSQIIANGGFQNPNLASLPDPMCGPRVATAFISPDKRTMTVVEPPPDGTSDQNVREGQWVSSYTLAAFTDKKTCAIEQGTERGMRG